MRKGLLFLVFSAFLIGATAEKIKIANLIIGLELTPQQISTLKNFQREVIQKKEELESSFLAEKRKALLQEIYAQLRTRGRISPEVAREFHLINSRIKRQYEDFLEWERRKAEEFFAILKPYQQKALEDYVPCIIPPQKGSRVGQANANSHILRALERIRQIPYFRWERVKHKIAQRIASRDPAYLFMEKSEREAREKEILGVLEEARELSDEEFLLRREELASKLKPEERRRSPVLVIMKFLLSSEAAEVLQELNLKPVQ